MELKIAQFVSATPADFVSFWSKQYRFDNPHLYDDSIGLPLTEERVWNLYRWKNGTERIAEKKEHSIRTAYLRELVNLPSLTTLQDGQDYLTRLSGGAIWDIFWLHCVNRDLFPIFDQHTYRSMATIESLPQAEIPRTRRRIVEAYFSQYIPFTRRFTSAPPREVDKALFAYGRFLKKGLSGK